MYTGKAFAISLITSFLVSVVICAVFLLVLPNFISFPMRSAQPTDEKVEVPRVTNMPVDEANLVIQNKGLLMMKADEKDDPNTPLGNVISQDPLPGFRVEKGSLVKVVVSVGGPEIVIPNLEEIPQGQARLQLESIGLVIGTTTREDHDAIAKDAVIRTDPPAGVEAPAGTKVNLVLSSGVSMVEVPKVFRMSPSSARSRIESRGLQMRTSYTTNIDYEFGIVVGQNPRAGKMVKRGSSVTIMVNAESR